MAQKWKAMISSYSKMVVGMIRLIMGVTNTNLLTRQRNGLKTRAEIQFSTTLQLNLLAINRISTIPLNTRTMTPIKLFSKFVIHDSRTFYDFRTDYNPSIVNKRSMKSRLYDQPSNFRFRQFLIQHCLQQKHHL